MRILALSARRQIPPQDRAMLPDFRVVTIAVIATFLFAASVGFYTSSRLASERKPRPETLAAIEENPLNRIALNWPEPVQPTANSLDLDFAVTSKVLRNPVRDVSDDAASAPAPEPKVAAAPPASSQNIVVEPPVVQAQKPETPDLEIPKVETPKAEAPRLDVAQIETPRMETPKPEPVMTPVPVAPVAPQAKPEEEIPTASIVETPRQNASPPRSVAPSEVILSEPQRAAEPPAIQIASHPAPDSLEAKPEIAPEPAPAIKRNPAKKAAKRKAAKKTAPRPRPRILTKVTSTNNILFPFFGIQ
jgi:hypothetical protein